MSSESSFWLERTILKQERSLRRQYEQVYLSQCSERGEAPKQYAAWRHFKNEPKILEMLVEEDQANRSLVIDKEKTVKELMELLKDLYNT